MAEMQARPGSSEVNRPRDNLGRGAIFAGSRELANPNEKKSRGNQPGLLLQSLRKLTQLLRVQIGYRPVVHFPLGPVEEVVAPAGAERGRGVTARGRRSDKKIDRVLVPSVNERRDGFAAKIIEPAAGQGKTSLAEIAHRRREIDLTVEPWFDRVLVRRAHIDAMGGEEG